MIRLIKDVLKSSDYFGKNIQLIFNKQSKFSTHLGGVLTIIIIILSFSLVISLGSELFERKSPKTNFNSSFQRDSPIIYFNDNLTTFSFQFLDKDLNTFYDETYLVLNSTLTTFLIYENSTSYVTQKPIILSNCSNYINYFINDKYNFSLEFKLFNLYDSLCMVNNSIPSGGSFNSKVFQNLNFLINICDNKTMNNSCKTKEEIDKKISGGYLQIFYLDRYIDAVEYFSPLKTYLNTYFIQLDTSFYKSSDIYFKIVNISSETGIIYEKKSYTSSIIFDYFREQFYFNTNTETILTLNLNSSNNGVYITRYYMKLSDLTATVGGIFQIYILIGKIISNQFNKYKMYEKIMNSLYEFNIDDQCFDELIVKKVNHSIYAEEINRKQTFFENLKKKLKEQKTFNNILNNDYKLTKIDLENRNMSSNNVLTNLSNKFFQINSLKKFNDKKNISISYGEKPNNRVPTIHNENLILDSNLILEHINLNEAKNNKLKDNLNTESNLIISPGNINCVNKTTMNNFSGPYDTKKFNKVSKTLKNNVFYTEILKKIEHFKKTMNGKIKISYCDILGMILCRKCIKVYKKKYNLVSKTEEEMTKFIDFIEIAKVLQEFTKLKLVLLSDKQLSLFSFISKPQIFYNDNTVKNSFLHGKIFEKRNIDLQTLYELYTSTKEKGENMSLIDKRIIEFLDEDLKKTFELAMKKTEEIENDLNF